MTRHRRSGRYSQRTELAKAATGRIGAAVITLLLGCGTRPGAAPVPTGLKPSTKTSGPPSTGSVVLLSGKNKYSNLLNGLLLRELMRQSWLMAARDGLGRPTRDGVLREILPSGGELEPFEMHYVFRWRNEESAIEFERARNQGTVGVLNETFSLNINPKGDWSPVWRKWITDAELLSRTKFVDALKRANYRADGNRVATDRVVDAEVERQLSEIDVVSQFSALRRLHAQVRRDGESAQQLGGLARAYAQLGVLTESHFSPIHKVFKARALLYAERLVVAYPDLPSPLWHRAFVRAVVGLHSLALEDIEAAEKLPKAAAGTGDSTGEAPPWLKLVDAYCHFDGTRLLAAKQDPALAPFAALLRLLLAESSEIVPQILDVAQELLETSPNCDRAVDAIFGSDTLGARRMAATVGGHVVAGRLTERLATLPDFPESVRAALLNVPRADVGEDNDLDETLPGPRLDACAEAVRLLRQTTSDDIGEPSWCVLATILEDAIFGQVWRELVFEQYALGVPISDSLARWQGLAGDHPLKAAIAPPAPTATEPNARGKATETAGGSMRDFDFELREESLLGHAKPFAANERSLDQADSRGDWVYPDLLLSHRTLRRRFPPRDGSTPNYSYGVKDLLEVSPYSPQSIAIAVVDAEWNSVKDQVDEWERQYAKDASVQFAFGLRYESLERYEDAERCLKRAVALASQQQYFKELAALYARRGDTHRWQATLEDFLKQPSYGLEGDNVRVQLADHFAARHEWQKALEYAEQAAQSGAAWAMLAAGRSHEALQQWQEAEEAYRATSLRYDSQRFLWYAFCKRTGQGDVDSARDVAKAYIDELEPRVEGNELWPVMAFQLLEGRSANALEIVQEMIERRKNPFFIILGALLADELNDVETRDLLLKTAAIHEVNRASPDNAQPIRELIYVADALIRDIAAGGKGDLELDNLDQLLGRAGENIRLAAQYLIGYYLDLHGKPEVATEYLKRAMISNPAVVTRTYAGQRLLARGIGPEAYRDAMLSRVEKEITPQE